MDKFYAIKLWWPEPYQLATGSIREVHLNRCPAIGWFSTHKWMGVINHCRQRDIGYTKFLKPDIEKFLPEEEQKLILFEGIIGLVEICGVEKIQFNHYKFYIGRSEMLSTPFALTQHLNLGGQLSLLPDDLMKEFMLKTGICEW